MDGYKATKIIRKTDQDIPIIALTANAMKEHIDKTKIAGMQEHLNKPLDIQLLFKTLLKYISKKIYDFKLPVNSNEDITIPIFINIDTKLGLS